MNFTRRSLIARWPVGCIPPVRASFALSSLSLVRDATVSSEFAGTRYVFGRLQQKTLSMDSRVNVTFTPNLTLEMFAQPFLASGKYLSFKEFAEVKSRHMNLFGGTMGAPLSRIRIRGRVRSRAIRSIRMGREARRASRSATRTSICDRCAVPECSGGNTGRGQRSMSCGRRNGTASTSSAISTSAATVPPFSGTGRPTSSR